MSSLPLQMRLRLIPAITLLAGLSISAVPVVHAASTQRPNIILLLPDQMRASAMGVAGNPDV